MLCKEAGVKEVIVKCSNELHRKLLEKVGADRVVQPEKESGIRLAKNLLSSGFVDVVELSDEVSIVELDIKKEWLGKSLIELDLRRKYGINVIALNYAGKISCNVNPEEALAEGSKLVVIADVKKLSKLR